MKKMKKFLALLITLAMVLSMGMTVFATGETEGGDEGGDEGGTPTAVTTGTITLKNATKGYAYTAYKILDATYKTTTTGEGDEATTSTSVAYTTKNPEIFKGEGSPWIVAEKADASGNYNVQLAEEKTADDVNAWIKTNIAHFSSIAPGEGVDEDGLASAKTVKWKGLNFGYYYITSGLGANVTVDSTTPDVEVYDKNTTEPEDPEKTIIEVDGVAKDKVTQADAHVGSIVKFQIDAKTNNWIDKDTIRTEWEITDTPTNMTIDKDSVEVKVNGSKLTSGYSATVTDGVLKVNIPMIDNKGNSIYAANTLDTNDKIYGLIPIEITYTATIDKEAGDAPAKNQIPGPGETPPPPVVINTYAFQVAKVDGEEYPLQGAQFELWSKKSGNTDAKLTFIDNDDGTYTYSEAATGTVTTLDMTTNTTIVIKGLDKEWTYTLKEITVPEGYNQADDKTVNGSDLTKVAEKVVQGDGTETTTTVTDTTINSTELFKATVKNNAGAELPSTGGIGTTIFYIVGAILVVGAGVVLITRRRMGVQ